MTCPNCSAENSPEARFCSSCGHALVTRVAVEERRHVTALFADLVASTSMSDQLDPEVVRGFVSRYFERATDEIRQHGGSVEKFSGDAVLALFGLQVAHEDDPERAVRSAFAILDLEHAGDQEHLADVLYDLAWEGWWLGDVERARAGWERAADLARKIGDPARETRALLRISGAHAQMGQIDEAEGVLDRALKLSEATSRLSQAEVWLVRGPTLYFTGRDPDAGRELIERALVVAEESGSREHRERALQMLGYVALIEGDLSGAVARFEEQVAILAEVGHAGRLPEADRNLAGALVDAGDIERAEFHALRAVETVEPDDWFTVGTSRVALGRVRDAQGREDEAAQLIREGRETVERTAFQLEMGELYAMEAEFHLGHGREEEGTRVLDRARQSILAVSGPASPLLAYIERRAAEARRRAVR